MSKILQITLGAFNGVGIGLLIGAVAGGAIGFFYPRLSYDPPNGNPTELQFYDFMVTCFQVAIGLVGAGFGGLIGAYLGAVVGSLLAVKRRITSQSIPVDASPNTRDSEQIAKSGGQPNQPTKRNHHS